MVTEQGAAMQIDHLAVEGAIEYAHSVPKCVGRNGRYETGYVAAARFVSGRLALYGWLAGIMRVKIEKSADPDLDAFENFSQV